MSFFRDLRRSYFEFRQGAGGTVIRGPRLVCQKGKVRGYVERLCFTPKQTRVEGWADVACIRVTDAGGREIARSTPSIGRSDVQSALGTARNDYGFNISLPAMQQPCMMHVSQGDMSISVVLPRPSAMAMLWAELRLLRRYMITLPLILPDAVLWLRRRDVAARRRIGAVLRGADTARPMLDMATLAGPAWNGTSRDPITIVMPVYQRLDLIDEAIGRVLDHTDLPWHLVAVEDASPDRAVAECLREWQARLTPTRMTLIENARNLGFVGSVNRALDVARRRGHDVVLLNTDALVPKGWASRLLMPMRTHARIASVTPLSNDAEIANVPSPCAPMSLRPGEGDALDDCARKLASAGAVADVPTGVGFCMAMNIKMLQRIPQLDTVFGKGYGEEVDWCQRAAALGWRNVLNAGVFVEHRGGQSFGSALKQTLMRQNGALISKRYPQFDQQVQTFLRNDPLLAHRLKLGIALACHRARDQSQRLSVFLGHGLGGGAEVYLAQRLQQQIDLVGHAVVIRAMPDTTWQIELHGQSKVSLGVTEHITDLVPLFSELSGLHVVYSCGVGACRPEDIPTALRRISGQPDSTLEVAFNDYFPLSPSYTLLDSDGFFRGLPLDPDDGAHQFHRSDRQPIMLPEWTTSWGAMLQAAERLTTFSPSSAALVARAWPELEDRIVMEPHKVPHSVPAILPRRERGQIVIGVLGNINRAKGAEVLVQLSRALAASGRGKLVLIGNIEPGYKLTAPSTVLGSYRIEQLPELVAKHGITRWFFPSVWPETFSYAVHEMISTQLPVWSFDLGGQADAVADALRRGHQGGLISLEAGCHDIAKVVRCLVGPLSELDEGLLDFDAHVHVA